MRLIDLDVAIKDARANYGDVHDAVIMEHFLNAQPTVDAAPVVHGQWVNEDFPENLATVHDMAQCSVCGELSHKAEHGYAILSKFCPNCGAKMDLPEGGE